MCLTSQLFEVWLTTTVLMTSHTQPSPITDAPAAHRPPAGPNILPSRDPMRGKYKKRCTFIDNSTHLDIDDEHTSLMEPEERPGEQMGDENVVGFVFSQNR